MICYVVIDTNVLVSALLSSHEDAATVQVLKTMLTGDIIPVYSDEILTQSVTESERLDHLMWFLIVIRIKYKVLSWLKITSAVPCLLPTSPSSSFKSSSVSKQTE